MGTLYGTYKAQAAKDSKKKSAGFVGDNDLAISAARQGGVWDSSKQKHRSMDVVKKTITKACATDDGYGNYMASKAKRAIIYQDLLKESFGYLLKEKELKEKDLSAIAHFLPKWAADDINVDRHIIEEKVVSRLRYASHCRNERGRVEYGAALAFLASSPDSVFDKGRDKGRPDESGARREQAGPQEHGGLPVPRGGAPRVGLHGGE